jgi:hypothetical protein
VQVWRGGGGIFTLGASATIAGAPVSLALGDFDLDGLLDVVAADTMNDKVWVVMQSEDGGFRAPTSIGTNGLGPIQVVSADFNQDGKMDFVVFGSGSDAYVYFNTP